MTRSNSKRALFDYQKNLTNLINPKKVNLTMEEQKPAKRTMDEIKSEFVKVCSRAGNAAFQREELRKEIEALQKRMIELNAEATELSKENSDAKV